MSAHSISVGRWRVRKKNTRDPVRQLIGGFDDHLSRSHGVRTFSEDERCILRYAPISCRAPIHLSDGVTVRLGDIVLDIHCWNERVPVVPPGGPDIAWAQETSRRLKRSLQLLAAAMPVDPALREARACRARVSFVGQGGSNASVSRIIRRMGFEDVDEGAASAWGRVHDRLENLLLAALVWTHNPDALRRDKMIRERRPVWSSRDQVLRYHGAAPPERATLADATPG